MIIMIICLADFMVKHVDYNAVISEIFTEVYCFVQPLLLLEITSQTKLMRDRGLKMLEDLSCGQVRTS